jgi:hypothetical protein
VAPFGTAPITWYDCPAGWRKSGEVPLERSLVNSVICCGYPNESVLVEAHTLIPLTDAPVWLARVPCTMTVESGPAVVGVIPVMAIASVCALVASDRGDCC